MKRAMSIIHPMARARRGALWLFVAVGLIAALTACDDRNNVDLGVGPGSDNTGPTTTTATTSLGPVSNAAVIAFAADALDAGQPLSDQKDAVLAQAKTDADGVAAGLDLGDYAGPVLYALVADSQSNYYDEAAGDAVAFPGFVFFPDSAFFPDSTFFPDSAFEPSRREDGAQLVMAALTPRPREQVAITPLTTLALAAASLRETALSDADAIRKINTAIRDALAPELGSILDPPTVFDSNTTTGSLDANDADQYALRLAGLAKLEDDFAAPALLALVYLVQDLLDNGVLDASYRSGDLPIAYRDFAAEWQQALEQLAGAYGTQDLQDAVANYDPADIDPFADTGDNADNGGAVAAPGTVTGTVDGGELTAGNVIVPRYKPGQFVIVTAVKGATTNGWLLSIRLDGSDALECVANDQGEANEALIGVTLSNGPDTEPTTYTAPGENGGGACQLEITQNDGPGGTLAGQFEGTLADDSGHSVDVTGGAFNVTLPDEAVGAAPPSGAGG